MCFISCCHYKVSLLRNVSWKNKKSKYWQALSSNSCNIFIFGLFICVVYFNQLPTAFSNPIWHVRASYWYPTFNVQLTQSFNTRFANKSYFKGISSKKNLAYLSVNLFMINKLQELEVKTPNTFKKLICAIRCAR